MFLPTYKTSWPSKKSPSLQGLLQVVLRWPWRMGWKIQGHVLHQSEYTLKVVHTDVAFPWRFIFFLTVYIFDILNGSLSRRMRHLSVKQMLGIIAEGREREFNKEVKTEEWTYSMETKLNEVSKGILLVQAHSAGLVAFWCQQIPWQALPFSHMGYAACVRDLPVKLWICFWKYSLCHQLLRPAVIKEINRIWAFKVK